MSSHTAMLQLALGKLSPLWGTRKGKFVLISAASAVAVYLGARRLQNRRLPPLRYDSSVDLAKSGKAPDPTKTRVAVDGKFFERLRRILRIVIPGWRSKEFLLLLVHSGVLLLRTLISLYVAELDGRLVKAIVDQNLSMFILNLLKWIGIALPATYLNSMIRFLDSKLALAFRTRLSDHVYAMYMSNETYYRVGNLDSRMSNPDQCLTEDVSKFCTNLAHLHSQISKPLLDVVLITTQIWMTLLRRGSLRDNMFAFTMIYLVVFGTVRILRAITPPFGRMVAEQAAREGNLRFVHSRVIAHAEEIAFYHGHKIELSILTEAYYDLVKHMNSIFKSRIFYNMMEGFLMKYVWSAAGLCMTAMPLFLGSKDLPAGVVEDARAAANRSSDNTQYYITQRKLLTDGADAIERIMSAYKEVTELAGYTFRVDEMLTVFEDMNHARYQKQLVTTDFTPGDGKVTEGNFICLKNVPIVTPNGDVLVRSLSIDIRPGMHLLITGPNGCGKSSLFRIVGALWPVCGGEVVRPRRKDIFYIPQRPYLALGTLRDQVIYPDTRDDLRKKGLNDRHLDSIMEWVNLTYVVTREGGWDARNEWGDTLSGGEKQRIGMARLFYHKPHFAFLDECTSAVSIDVEGKMYQHAIDEGITLLTVTHRPTLWKYHNHLLQYDGEGGWRFSELNATARLSLKEEKTQLEQNLASLPKKQERLRELCLLLGEDSTVLEEVKLIGSRNTSRADLTALVDDFK